jgi:hypothetical protein
MTRTASTWTRFTNRYAARFTGSFAGRIRVGVGKP